MTKSQNTKNEQHCIKQNEKSFIQKDLSLTELWQKGELPSGEYYIIDDLGLHTTDRYYPSHGFGAELPQSVLGRVPTFDEWQSKLEENAQLKELIEKDKKVFAESRIYPSHLISEDLPVKYDIDKYKEAVELIKKGLQETIDGYRMTPISRAELLLKELNEVLK